MIQKIIGLFVIVFATWALCKGISPAFVLSLIGGIVLILTNEFI